MNLITSRAWPKVNGGEASTGDVVKEIDAVYEAGVLRSVEPLPFAGKQRVRVTASDEPVVAAHNPRTQKFEWLRLHRDQFAGKWVALYWMRRERLDLRVTPHFAQAHSYAGDAFVIPVTLVSGKVESTWPPYWTPARISRRSTCPGMRIPR